MKNSDAEGTEKQRRTTKKKQIRLSENEVTEIIIGCAIKVHTILGPGLSKAAYEECMGYALSNTGLEIERQKTLPLNDDEVKLDAHRLDFLANRKVILEIKSGDTLHNSHLEKIHSCLRLSGCKSGLLIDFNVEHLRNGIKRVANHNYRCRSLSVSPVVQEKF